MARQKVSRRQDALACLSKSFAGKVPVCRANPPQAGFAAFPLVSAFCPSRRAERRCALIVPMACNPSGKQDMPLDVEMAGGDGDNGNPVGGFMLGAAMIAVAVGGFFAWNIYESGSAASQVLVVQSR